MRCGCNGNSSQIETSRSISPDDVMQTPNWHATTSLKHNWQQFFEAT